MTDLICLTIRDANLKNSGIDLAGHMDFFPTDSHGGRNKDHMGKTITITFSGIGDEIQTDIDGRLKVFRNARGQLRRFYEHYHYRIGEMVYITRVADRVYRVSHRPPNKVSSA